MGMDGNHVNLMASHCWCFVRDCPSPAPVPSVSMVSLHGGFHCLRRVPTTQSVSMLLTNIDNQRKIAKSEALDHLQDHEAAATGH